MFYRDMKLSLSLDVFIEAQAHIEVFIETYTDPRYFHRNLDLTQKFSQILRLLTLDVSQKLKLNVEFFMKIKDFKTEPIDYFKETLDDMKTFVEI